MLYHDYLIIIYNSKNYWLPILFCFKKRLEEFSKKCSALHRDNEEAHAKISALTDALYEKKRDVESLTNQLER